MSDQCRLCVHRGNLAACAEEPCSIKESWGYQYARQAAVREVVAAIDEVSRDLYDDGRFRDAESAESIIKMIEANFLSAPAEPPDSGDPIVDGLPAWVHLVIAEREAQDAKWGANRDLDPFVWAAILTEEVGEVARCCLQSTTDEDRSLMDLPMELVQVAAVATQMLESIERRLATAPADGIDSETTQMTVQQPDAPQPPTEPYRVGVRDVVCWLHQSGRGEAARAVSKAFEPSYLHIGPIDQPAAEVCEWYLVATDKHGYVGNSVLFWRPEGAGYTTDIADAGRYSLSDAENICREGMHASTHRYWVVPESWAAAHGKLHLSDSDLARMPVTIKPLAGEE